MAQSECSDCYCGVKVSQVLSVIDICFCRFERFMLSVPLCDGSEFEVDAGCEA